MALKLLHFLNAEVPLTKAYERAPDGSISKTSYPNIWQVTSVPEQVKTLKGFAAALVAHGQRGNCLLKGDLLKPLVNESRANSTDRNAQTDWLCLDIDGVDDKTTVDEILSSMNMSNVSYVLQWSGSMGISAGLRCHVFMMLSKPVAAPLIKQWLMQCNHEVPALRAHQSLTKTGNSLTWGLDVTACQADKLIYIAPPLLKNISNPLGKRSRISIISKPLDVFDFPVKVNTAEQNRALTDARVLELRDREGLPKRKMTYRSVGGHEILSKPGECIATEIKHDRGFVYFNLNGGDSWAYYHPENNPDYIFNFKGEPVYLTKELLPTYWESLKTQAYRISSTGQTYLTFLDRKTSAYWRGTYDETQDHLEIYQAKTESMVRQFADANGLRLGDNIPEWDMEFNPHDDVRVDFSNSAVNTFQRTSFMKATPPKKPVTSCPPTIMKIIRHVLCSDVEAIEHFVNWLSFITQERERTMTAWIFQGTQGTGKGVLFNKILAPIFGVEQTVIKRANELSEKWTDFVAGKFIVFIDEIQTSAFRDEASVISNLKNFITEPTVTVRMMNKNSYAVQNYTNWIMASNKPDPVTVDKEDRRFNVGPYQAEKLAISQAELDVIPGELQSFYNYLMQYVVDHNQVTTPLQSAARETLIQLSQTTSETAAAAMRDGDLQFFFDQLPDGEAYKANALTFNKVEDYRKVLHDVLARTKIDGSCNIRRDEAMTIFDYTVGGMSTSPATFTRYLGHRQIAVKAVSIGGKTERGFSTRWTNHKQLLSAVTR